MMTPRLWSLAIWCADQELEGRKDGTRPGGVKAWNGELLRALQFQLSVSQSGHETGCSRAQSETDKWISTRETALLLGLSKRQVNRLADDLEAEWLDGRRMFRESLVLEYAKGRRDGQIA